MGGVIAPSFEELAAQQDEAPAVTPDSTNTTAEGSDTQTPPATTESPSGDGEA